MHIKKVTLVLVTFLMLALDVCGANSRFTLVIDAGHGGHDAGALGAVSKEKNINLSVALRFGEYVEKNMPDVKVVYTRKTDVFVPLQQRANIANKANADLFISVHTNALPGGKVARGFETYTLGMHRAKDNLDVAMRENSVISMEQGYQQTYQGFDPNSSESYIIFEFIQGKNMERSVELASMIQRKVCNDANRPNKGVHQAGFLVLRETSMPSCLIELGFITTPDEETLLNNASRVDDIAKALYEAFSQYKNKYDKRVAVPYRADTTGEPEVPSIVPESYRETKASKKMVAAKAVESNEVATRAADNDGKQTVEEKNPDQPAVQEETPVNAPVFKVQILTSGKMLAEGDSRLKGVKDYDCYQENGMVKYTVGASANYSEIYRLRKTLVAKFPEAFIIAFKEAKKCDVNQAIQEYKRNKNK